MGRFNLDILFKQTTSERIKCKICCGRVDGEDGYIKINFYNFGVGWYSGNTDRRIVICNKCFKEWTDKITTARDKGGESYNKMVKTKILKSLSK